jgi:succinate-semialdehyde dehydrogenase/glutarate-semialdehyde dehydrogenase
MIELEDKSLLKTHSYVDGVWQQGETYFAVMNPANRQQQITLSNGDVALAESAIVAAENAFQSWRKTSAKQRADLMKKWFDLMMAAKTDLGKILT